MKIYTYSEARRLLARVLDEAQSGEDVRIRRRDGSEFILAAVVTEGSPLDVPGVDTDLSRDEIVSAIREGRERER